MKKIKNWTFLFAIMLVWFSCAQSSRNESGNESIHSLQNEISSFQDKFKSESHKNEIPESISDFQYKLQELSQEEIFELFRFEISQFSIDTSDIPGKSRAAMINSDSASSRSCGTSDPAPKTAKKAYRPRFFYSINSFQKKFKIPIIFHLIKRDANDNHTSKAELDKQIIALNDAFRPVKIQFYIEEITDTIKSSWFNAWPDNRNKIRYKRAVEMTSALSKNQENSINIYINEPTKLYGAANFPWTNDYFTPMDHINIHHLTLPDHKIEGMKAQGKTLVHEMGHFFGLWHTFHDAMYDDTLDCNVAQYNGCTGIGDRILDTPPQKICLFLDGYCFKGTSDECTPPVKDCELCDTCPGDNLKDPINNFMGYNSDAKMVEFTPGQISRMQTHLFFGDRRYLIEDQIKNGIK